jgi:kynureninase
MEAPLDPNVLRPHYRAFLRDDRILLTGHSHQAWPDVAREGMVAAFEAAATHVDDKWGEAFAAATAVREAVASRVGVAESTVALGASTHDLLVRLLSALPLRKKRHIVTTSGEFHTLYRQLRRLSEEGVSVDFVNPLPVATLAERLAAAVRDDTAALFVSTVLFESSTLVPHLSHAVDVARKKGAEVVLDTYHHFMVKPLRREDYGDVFLLGGGYKYAQWGEGVCFMTVPESCSLRPVVTGWFSDFAHLSAPRDGAKVTYGPTLAERFAGSTYDPTSHFRARAVLRFFDERGMTVPRLAAGYSMQTSRIFEALASRGHRVVSPSDVASRGGFVAVAVENPAEVIEKSRRDGVLFDARGDIVRLGPAPYLTDAELDRGVEVFATHAKPKAA